MKALVLQEKDKPLEFLPWKNPEPEPGEVVVTLKAAALNHRDVFITQGLYPGIVYPIILGSDGAGLWEDREVIINPAINWGKDARVPGRDFHILGLPKNGTFAEKVAVGRSQLFDKPPHLDWAQAAALPLAGLTAYRALFSRGRLQVGERVLISGVGGGVALLACQFALAIGAKVWVTSGSQRKIERAREMGALGGVNYRDDDWTKQLKAEAKGFDLIVDSAGGNGFAQFLKLCNPAGRIVTYGGTQGKVDGLSPQILFWKQLDIMGTTMGNDREFADMISFVNRHEIVPVVDERFPLSQADKGFQRMEAGKQFGKIAFEI